eukprot:3629316-Prymnesium_polylepis.2
MTLLDCLIGSLIGGLRPWRSMADRALVRDRVCCARVSLLAVWARPAARRPSPHTRRTSTTPSAPRAARHGWAPSCGAERVGLSATATGALAPAATAVPPYHIGIASHPPPALRGRHTSSAQSPWPRSLSGMAPVTAIAVPRHDDERTDACQREDCMLISTPSAARLAPTRPEVGADSMRAFFVVLDPGH